jgi:hypothetical protein
MQSAATDWVPVPVLRFPAGRRHRASGSAHSEGHRGYRPPERIHDMPAPLHGTHDSMKPQKVTSELQGWARHKRVFPYMQERHGGPAEPSSGKRRLFRIR